MSNIMFDQEVVAKTGEEFLELFVGAIDAEDGRMVDSLLKAKTKDPRFPLDVNKCTILASSRGDAVTLAKLIAINPRMSYGDTQGRRAIHHAAVNGHVECARILLRAGAISNCSDIQGRTPLHLACLMGHVEIVRLLIRQCAHVNSCRTESGDNALHVTAATSHLAVMEILLDNGGDIGVLKRKTGQSPLHVAVMSDKPEMVELLCSRGANPDLPDGDKQLPIHHAAERGFTRCLSVLLGYGASIEVKDKLGQTALSAAVNEGQMEATRLLLENNADVFCEDNSGFSVLHKAALRDNTEMIEMLVSVGADVNSLSHKSQRSALISAVSLGRLNAIKKLIKLGADVTLADCHGNTPLHMTFFKLGGSPAEEIVRVLLASGSRLDPRDRGQLTPLQRCLEVGIVRRGGALACVRLLCEAGSNLGPDTHNHGAKSPLFRQAYTGFLHEALYLGRAGWDLRQESWLSLPGKTSQQDKLHALLIEIRDSFPTLLSSCRKIIRQRLASACKHREILSAIGQLPVPTPLKRYLCLQDIQVEEKIFDT